MGRYYLLGNFEDEKGYTASVSYFDEAMLYTGRSQVRLKAGTLPVMINEIAADSRFLEKYASVAVIGDSITLSLHGEVYEFNVTAILSNVNTGMEDFGFIVSEDFLKSFPGYEPSGYRAYVHFTDADTIDGDELKEMAASAGEELGLGNIVFHSVYFIRNKGVSAEDAIIVMILALLILTGGSIVIQSIFRISIDEKIRFFGRLRTLGATRKQIGRIVRRESRLLAWFGIPIGNMTGLLSGTIMMRGSIAGCLNITNILVIAFFVTGLCLLLVHFSIRRPVKIASGASPMDAVRFSSYQGSGGSGARERRKITPYRLALVNLSRDKIKAFGTLLSLIFGGLLLFVSASLFGSYSPEQNARLAFPEGDFKIYLHDENSSAGELIKTQNPLTQALCNEILSIDGVKDVIEKRNSVGGTDYSNGNIEEGGMCDIITPENAAFVERNLIRGTLPQQDDEILLPDLSQFEHINPGEALYIKFDCSDSVYSAKVTGFFDNSKIGVGNGKLGIDGAQILITQGLAKEVMPDVSHYAYTWEIVTDPEKNKEIQGELKTLTAGHPGLAMFSYEEETANWEAQWNVVLGGMQGISWLIFVFGIVNLINMTLSNQFSRKKEISMMRSVGMTRKQLYRMLLTEGDIFVFSSVLVMAAAGVPVSMLLCGQLGRMMYQQPMAFRFPFLQAGIYLLILLAAESILSAWSIRSMNRRPLVEQLRTIDQ